MRLPTFAKPVLSRSNPTARAHAGGITPQMQTVMAWANCPPGHNACGANYLNAAGQNVRDCCNGANEQCYQGQCLPNATVAALQAVGMPNGVAQMIAGYAN